MKTIEIEKKKKLPKNKIKSLKFNIDFSSFNKLKGNKGLLEHSFFVTKMMLLND